MKKIHIDILEFLKKENQYCNSREMLHLMKKHKMTIRVFQNTLSSLVSSKRIIKEGTTSDAKYFFNDNIEKWISKYEFLYVKKNNILAGYFIKTLSEFIFYYDTEYLINEYEPIDTIKLGIEEIKFNSFPPIFEDNIPEGINKEILEIDSSSSNEFDFLHRLENSIGELEFCKFKEELDIKKSIYNVSYIEHLDNEILETNPKINVLNDYTIDLKEDRIFPEGEDLSKITRVVTQGISGFQYKLILCLDKDSKQIREDKEGEGIYIFKPYSKLKSDIKSDHYFPHLSLNEHLFMSFAKNELNFRVPYSAIFKREKDKEYHYLVKRFDRIGINKFNMTTFAPFLGLTSDTKYNISSEKMFKRISIEIKNPKERMELLKHYAYSVIIKHEDMHTKNLSLIKDGNKVYFAPLYDICCTGIYDTSKGFDSHLTINGKQKNIRPNDFKQLCRSLKIDLKDFKKEAYIIAEIYKEKLPIYIEEIKNLGDIPFHKSKLKMKIGEGANWIRNKKSIQFHEVLSEFHKKRIEELNRLGWITNK